MADNTAVYTGTGRRKEAVARVRLVPGTGKVTVNGREATQYFGRQQLVDNATAPLRITDTLGLRKLRWRRHQWSVRRTSPGHRSRSS